MTQTSAGPSFPSTGIFATRSIHSWMASVMCGTTYQQSKDEIKTKTPATITNSFKGENQNDHTDLDSLSKIISSSLLLNNRLETFKIKNQ